MLSKSKFRSGWQCPLQLWYDIYNPALASEKPESLQAIFLAGQAVGILAHRLFPGGVVVETDPERHADAVFQTQALMSDPNVPAIFEASFVHDAIRVKADILVRDGDSWRLIEVKSSSELKEVNRYDVALQYHVLSGFGVKLSFAGLYHINKLYVYDGIEIDPMEFFTIDDLTNDALSLQAEVVQIISDLKSMLSTTHPPAGDVPFVCSDPYDCLYYEHCTKDKDEYWIKNLPRLRSTKLRELQERGIIRLQDLPADTKLSELQERVKEVVLSGKEYVSPNLKDILSDVEYPLYFLDFETFMPTIPRYKDTRPYQVLPFQWSCHVLHSDGQLEHNEYLCIEDNDPREEFTSTMLDMLGTSGTIVMYSHYEKRIINQLANELPQYTSRLESLVPRLWDLCAVIQANYYHRDFGGSFSIKSVLPALIPEMSYDILAISNGTQASSKYAEMIDNDTPQADKDRIMVGLIEYCKQDTLAMVKLRDKLMGHK